MFNGFNLNLNLNLSAILSQQGPPSNLSCGGNQHYLLTSPWCHCIFYKLIWGTLHTRLICSGVSKPSKVGSCWLPGARSTLFADLHLLLQFALLLQHSEDPHSVRLLLLRNPVSPNLVSPNPAGFAESRFTESCFAESLFAESRFAESRFAESRFAESRCEQPRLLSFPFYHLFGVMYDTFCRMRMRAVTINVFRLCRTI